MTRLYKILIQTEVTSCGIDVFTLPFAQSNYWNQVDIYKNQIRLVVWKPSLNIVFIYILVFFSNSYVKIVGYIEFLSYVLKIAMINFFVYIDESFKREGISSL